MTHPLLVLHDLGDARGGASWREVLARDGWDGAWSAPDQPGHGDAPWEADFYEPAHLVMAPLRHLLETGWHERPVIVGVGASAAAAELLALGGKASAVVLAGVPSPPRFEGPDDCQAAAYAWLRSVADDPESQSPAPYGRTDPRTRLGLAPVYDPEYADWQRSAISVPVLELESDEPAKVLAAVREWWAVSPGAL